MSQAGVRFSTAREKGAGSPARFDAALARRPIGEVVACYRWRARKAATLTRFAQAVLQ